MCVCALGTAVLTVGRCCVAFQTVRRLGAVPVLWLLLRVAGRVCPSLGALLCGWRALCARANALGCACGGSLCAFLSVRRSPPGSGRYGDFVFLEPVLFVQQGGCGRSAR